MNQQFFRSIFSLFLCSFLIERVQAVHEPRIRCAHIQQTKTDLKTNIYLWEKQREREREGTRNKKNNNKNME